MQDEGGDDGALTHPRATIPMIRRWWRTRVRRRDLEPGPPLPPDVEERIWAEVQRRIALGEAGRPQIAPLPDRRPLILTIALVVCALLTTGVLAAQRPATDQEVATADTVESTESDLTLADLARVARTREAEPLTDGHVLALTIDRIPTSTQAADLGWTEVQEITGDGRGTTALRELPDAAPGSSRRSESEEDEAGSLLVAGFTPDDIAALSGDPEALLDALRDAGGIGSGRVDAKIPLDLLATPLLSGPARAGLFHILDDLGAEVEGPATDASGRPGVLVMGPLGDDQIAFEAVVDPDTATVLSFRRRGPAVEESVPAITLYRSATVVPRR